MYELRKLKYGECYQFKGNLESLIECVFIENYFSRAENQNVSKRIVPDNTVELILTKNKFERRFSDEKSNQTLQSHLSGLKTKWQDILLEGSPLISIRFKPEIVYQLSALPASESVNQAIAPIDVFGKDFIQFEDELFNQDSTIQRLKLIVEYFTAKLIHTEIQEDNLFLFAKASIEASLGNLRISNLVADLQVSQKSLENKFKRFIGVTPKQYCRLIRFIGSIRNYNSSSSSLTSLAYENSFFDQSHFIKEIKQYTGLAPTVYFSQTKGIQEDIF